jgi:hypothetical protein
MVLASPPFAEAEATRTRLIVTIITLTWPDDLSLSGALDAAPVVDKGPSRKPRPVIGSADSWITRALGKEVKDVGEVVSD